MGPVAPPALFRIVGVARNRVHSSERPGDVGEGRSLRLFNPNGRSSSLVVAHPDPPRTAAHLAILDVLLRRTAARVQADHDFLTAVGTSHLSFGVEHDIVCQGIRADMTSLIVVIAVTEHGRLLYHPLTATIYTHLLATFSRWRSSGED